MNPTGLPASPRSSTAGLNPAGRDFSKQDYKDGTDQRHVDELHAMTLQGSEGHAQHPKTRGTLALTPVTFRFSHLPQDPADVMFGLLTHPDREAFANTSRSCAQLVTDHPGFSLTHQALTLGSLRLTRQLAKRLRQHEQASDTFRTLQIQSELSGSNHMSAAREAAIRGILETGVNPDCRTLLQRCDAFLAQLDTGAALDHDAIMEVVNTPGLGLISEWLLKMALDSHTRSPCEASATYLRQRLIELRQEVLMLAARAIAGQ